jgi:hypothetical protein
MIMILISFTFLGCGRFFEGTAEEMHTALNKTLAAVSDDTKVYASPAKLQRKHISLIALART